MMPSRTMTFEVSITRDYGAEKVTLSASFVHTVANDAEMDTQYAWLTDKLYNQHERHTRDFLPKVPDALASLASGEERGEWHPAERIVLEIKDRKRYYAVQGGKYSGHGVRVWEEVLKRWTFYGHMLENDELVLTDYEMFVVQGDKGVKVSKFRKVEVG